MGAYVEGVLDLYFTLKYVAGYGSMGRGRDDGYKAGRHDSPLEVTALWGSQGAPKASLYFPYHEQNVLHTSFPEVSLERERDRLLGDCDSHGPLLSEEQRRGPFQQFPFRPHWDYTG